MGFSYKISHGLKQNAANAVANGIIDEDDFIVFSDTDDELGFVSHDKQVKRIKARTDAAYTVRGTSIGGLADGDVIPSGSSIDDFIKLISDVDTPASIAVEYEIDSTTQVAGNDAVIKITPTFEKNDGDDFEEMKLMLNGVEIDSVEDGEEFEHEFEVQEGNNTFKVVATCGEDIVESDEIVIIGVEVESVNGSIQWGTIV